MEMEKLLVLVMIFIVLDDEAGEGEYWVVSRRVEEGVP